MTAAGRGSVAAREAADLLGLMMGKRPRCEDCGRFRRVGHRCECRRADRQRAG